MKKVIYTAFAAVLMLSACSTATKEKLGIAKKAPDEFMVVPKAPLTLPPEYDYNPVKAAPAVKPEVRLNDLTPAEAEFVSKFNASSPSANIESISSQIDKELKRFGSNE